MTPIVDLPRFREEYKRTVVDVMRFVTPERQRVIARHNPGLEPGRTNLTHYLVASEKRYALAVELFNAHLPATGGAPRVLDVGGFLGAYPLTLARMGMSVTLAEVYSYYGGAFDDLGAYLASEGIEIWDVDFTEPLADQSVRPFTMVTNMAMLEHLADSPGQLMRNLRAVTDDHGALVVETPNIAYWPRRWSLLRGQTVHPPLEHLFSSATPFLGHHREYTVDELTELLRWTGFRSEAVTCFNYSLSLRPHGRFEWIVPLVHDWPILPFRNCREVIMALAVPTAAAPPPGSKGSSPG